MQGDTVFKSQHMPTFSVLWISARGSQYQAGNIEIWANDHWYYNFGFPSAKNLSIPYGHTYTKDKVSDPLYIFPYPVLRNCTSQEPAAYGKVNKMTILSRFPAHRRKKYKSIPVGHTYTSGHRINLPSYATIFGYAEMSQGLKIPSLKFRHMSKLPLIL